MNSNSDGHRLLSKELKFTHLSTLASYLTPSPQHPKPKSIGVSQLARASQLLFRATATGIKVIQNQKDVLYTIPITNVTNISCSYDGRMLLAVHPQGLKCWDILSTPNNRIKATERWGLKENVIRDKECLYVSFSKKGYWVMIVTIFGKMLIYDATNGDVLEDVGVEKEVCAACWGECDGEEEVLALGRRDGSISIERLSNGKVNHLGTLKSPDIGECWFCNHLDWLNGGNFLAVGYYRITLKDDENYEDDPSEHESQLLIAEMSRSGGITASKWMNLGDVVPSFLVPRNVRRVILTCYLPLVNLLLVGSNLSNKIAVVYNCNDNWVVLDLQDGCYARVPTTPDDDYTYPTGMVEMTSSVGMPILLIQSTDGQLYTFHIQNQNDKKYGYAKPPINTLKSEPVPATSSLLSASGFVALASTLPGMTGVGFESAMAAPFGGGISVIGALAASCGRRAFGALESKSPGITGSGLGSATAAAPRVFSSNTVDTLTTTGLSSIPPQMWKPVFDNTTSTSASATDNKNDTPFKKVTTPHQEISPSSPCAAAAMTSLQSPQSPPNLIPEEQNDHEEHQEEYESVQDNVVDSTTGENFIPSKSFLESMELLGTTYCKEDHKVTTKNLSSKMHTPFGATASKAPALCTLAPSATTSPPVAAPRDPIKSIRLICFPWAGGTSRLYAKWSDGCKKNEGGAVERAFYSCGLPRNICVKVEPVDYPGRMARASEAAPKSVGELADLIVAEMFSGQNKPKDSEAVVLFGHSFGAIVAYEVALRLGGDLDKDNNVSSLLALFVSASRPPSAPSLVTRSSLNANGGDDGGKPHPLPVSKLSLKELALYFSKRGHDINPLILSNPNLSEVFLKSIQLDYHALETYEPNHAAVACPLVVLGGELDPGVNPKADLEDWVHHTKSEGNDVATAAFAWAVIPGWGHYYLADMNVLQAVGDTVALTVCGLLGYGKEFHDPPLLNTDHLLAKLAGHREGQDSSLADDFDETYNINDKIINKRAIVLLSVVCSIFAKCLSLEEQKKITIGPDTDFFYDLGGTSLDTLLVVSRLASAIGIRIPQSDIFVHSTPQSLALHLAKIESNSGSRMDEAPTIVPIEGSDGQYKENDATEGKSIWFPASAGQEQMISCWETSPSMYNMPTTIEFSCEPLNLSHLRKAFRAVIAAQPSLRTAVKVQATRSGVGRVIQYVLPHSVAMKCFELVTIQVECEDSVREIIERESLYVFDLANPPFVRGVIVTVVGSTEYLSYLLLNQHHVNSDGWSRTQLRRQILIEYLRLRAGGEEIKNTGKVYPNYVDWTMWSHKWLHDYGQKKKQIAYWKRKLFDLPVLELPTDYPRPAILSSRGARIPITVDSQTTRTLQEIASEEGANLYAALMALYIGLLHRWGGGDDFAIGIACANRQHEGLESLVGYFANEVSIRAPFKDGNLTFKETLRAVRQNILGGMANADVPFHEVTEALQVTRDRSRTSVFQAMFALQEREWHSVEDLNPTNEKLRFKIKQFDHNTSKFEVHLQLRHDGIGGLEGDFHIATDLFTQKTGKRMMDAFSKLLHACIEHPEKAIIQHDIVPEEDKTIISLSNSTSKSFDSTAIIDMIGSNEKDKVAIISSNGAPTLTYGQLWESAMAVGLYLICKVGAREHIGVLMKNSSQSISVVLGILMAGCAHVIVDLDKTPADRCKMILDDAEVSTIFMDYEFFNAQSLDLKVSSSWDIICIGNDVINSINVISKTCSQNNMSVLSIRNLQEEDIFGIYYTSGTTGLPKGVIITMGNVTNLTNWWREFFSLEPEDRVLLFSSLSFIMSLRQWVPTLCAGSKLVIPESSVAFESAIIEHSVNKLICTPSALAAIDTSKIQLIDSVQVAGEAPQLGTMKAWSKIARQLYIGLGPTELCAHALCGEFDGNTLSIGHPANNVRAYIVDAKTGLQLPINVVGELWVAGKNVAKGYLKQEEQTTKSFCMDPFISSEILERMYKTGDLARRLPDGRIQFIGRQDKQIKVNGFRIEPGDIISAMPQDVKSAYVLVENGRLVLYVSPIVEKGIILSSLKKKLPTYMIPSYIVPLLCFPLNKNKKVDEKALHELGRQVVKKDDQTFDVNWTTLESTIRLVWSEVLQLDTCHLPKTANFFEMGGTSLSAVIMSRKLTEELQVEVSVQDIFANQSISALAETIERDHELVNQSSMAPPLIFLPGGRNAMNSWVFGISQAIGLAIMSFLIAVPAFGTAFLSVRAFIWYGALGFVFFPPFLIGGCAIHMALVLLCKWTLIGRYHPGKARVFSWMFLKWWLVRRILHVTRLYTWIFDETALYRVWLLFLGAHIGKNVSVEQPYMLEPDLITIGDDCVAEFEVQFATAEIKKGILEFRKVVIGNCVKLGVRSVVLGGTLVHDGCEVTAKTTVDFNFSSTGPNQIVSGSPAKFDGTTSGNLWRAKQSWMYTAMQLVGCVMQVYLMACIVFVGAAIGLLIEKKYGSIALIAYLGSTFNILVSMLWVVVIAIFRRILIPRIIPFKEYCSTWFALRKWFLDRLFLSPVFAYATQRTLQTSSTFPWFMSLLGAKVGKKPWINHPILRTGVELITIGDNFHMGMLNYLSTETHSKRGVTFCPILIGDNSSFGQRCVTQSGSIIGDECTIGAETLIPHKFHLRDNGTTFGVFNKKQSFVFESTADWDDIVNESQHAAQRMLNDRNSKRKEKHQDLQSVSIKPISKTQKTLDAESCFPYEKQDQDAKINQNLKRRQDIGQGSKFWLYVVVMILFQTALPLIIGSTYGAVYFGFWYWLGEVHFEYLILTVPAIYIIGSIFLMIVLKLMQLCGGSFSIGTANFFGWRFFYWHVFADMVYLCTSSIIYPFSGTQLYCMWLRFMGAKVGHRTFISPENGGFREIDFLNIGNDVVLMTPNIHAHYTDHGKLQFCPVKFEDGVEINPGATIMPLTQYEKNSCLRPFAVTVKGQVCSKNTEYFGNPCKAIKIKQMERVAVLFPGQGSQYPGMLDSTLEHESARKIIESASKILGFDVAGACSLNADAAKLQDTRLSQPLVFVAGLAAAEVMRSCHPVSSSKIKACAGFSLGELTALTFAGAISLGEALNFVKARADAMALCNGGAMCNIRGVSLKNARDVCKRYGCYIANIVCNSTIPDYIKDNVFVLAGPSDAIEKLIYGINGGYDIEKGGPIARRLRVSGAFHTKQMAPAQHALRLSIKSMTIRLPKDVLVYSNVTGKPYTTISEIRRLLVQQIVSPVQWHDTIRDMRDEENIDTFMECGPMQMLSKTVRIIDPSVGKNNIICSDDMQA